MLRALLASLCALVALLVTSRSALADEPKSEAKGLAVVAVDGATDAAWPLAAAVYGSSTLKPPTIDDARARVLAGEPATTPELTELAELRAGVKGDDAASRQVLAALAQKLSLQGVVVVFAGTPPVARVWDAETRAFDAARYTAENGEWKNTVRSLERPYVPQPPPLVMTPPKETEPQPEPKKTESKAFWQSPWFWGAIGAVLLIGGGVLIATQVQTSDTIHLQLRMP